MKKTLLSIVTFLFCMTVMVSCSNEKVYHEFQLPALDEQTNYSIDYVWGQFKEKDATNETTGKYNILDKEDIEFMLVADDAYSLTKTVVKLNGTVIEPTEIRPQYYPYQDGYRYKIDRVISSSIITVENVVKKELKVTMTKARYRENESDTVGTVFEDYYDNAIKMEVDNHTSWGLTQAINDFNNKDKVYSFGDKIEILIGTDVLNCYDPHSYGLYGFQSDFNGMLREKDEDGGFRYLHNAKNSLVKNEDGSIVTKRGLYIFEIAVKEDMILCFDTMDLRASNYNIYPISENGERMLFNDTLDVIINGEHSEMQTSFGEDWYFEIDKKKIVSHPNLYDNMKVYINGELIEPNQQGLYEIKGTKAPLAFNRGNHDNDSEYLISFSGIDF